jgi:hypothetical protein
MNTETVTPMDRTPTPSVFHDQLHMQILPRFFIRQLSTLIFCVENGRGGHAQLFFESAIATPQLEGSTSAIAIPQLFKECCSATATPQFRNHNFL